MPFAAVPRGKISRFRRFTRRERWLFLRAALWLLGVDLGLRTFGFSRTQRWVSRTARSPGAAARRAEAEAVARIVDAAARHHFYPMRCLRRALVLGRLLADRGIPSELRIGVRRDEGELAAHAWVEHDGRPLSEPEDVERRFAALVLPGGELG